MCKRSRLASAFDGRGAAQNPGRWNGPGVSIVYTAESRSLASLEVLVHTEDTQVLAALTWMTIPVSIDEGFIQIAAVLPEDWRQLPVPQSTRELGTRWIEESRSAVLRVPSIVVDGEFNYLLNPRHPDFSRLQIGQPLPFSSDPRLTASLTSGSNSLRPGLARLRPHVARPRASESPCAGY
ncbi:MAG: RES family NAD+ phosphorylase [Steroidobacteraceae bacterium]